MINVDAVMAVQRMQDHIESCLFERITLKQLADAAGYSPWHAARLFREVTGCAPFDYIRRLRLTQASAKLRDGEVNVLNVALEFVFDSHEGFTRAFSKEFGITPLRYRRQTPPIKWFMPVKAMESINALHPAEQKGGNEMTKTVFVQVIERPARKLLLLRGREAEDYFEYCEEVGCDVWGILCSVKEALYEPVGLWLPNHLIPPGTSKYVQGVEVPLSYSNAVPDGFELIELPPCAMMVFQGEPFPDEEFGEAVGEVWKHIDRFNPELYGYQWAPEAAPRFQLEPQGYRGYIEARPVTAAGK